MIEIIVIPAISSHKQACIDHFNYLKHLVSQRKRDRCQAAYCRMPWKIGENLKICQKNKTKNAKKTKKKNDVPANILQWQKARGLHCPSELVIPSTIRKHIVKDKSDSVLSVLLSAVMPNTFTLSHSQRTHLFVHLYVKPTIYFYLPGWCVRWHWANLEKQRQTQSSGT